MLGKEEMVDVVAWEIINTQSGHRQSIQTEKSKILQFRTQN